MTSPSAEPSPSAAREVPASARLAGGRGAAERSVLVSTIAATDGGVPTMVDFAVECLERRGLSPVLAYYEPYSVARELSVPLTALLRRRPGSVDAERGGRRAHGIGAWLPELEFMHNFPGARWKDLIRGSRRHVVVSGNCLPAQPLAFTNTPFLAWIASDWQEDRADRAREFRPLRRAVDAALVRPVTRAIERRILRRGTILAIGEYTRRRLDAAAGRSVVAAVLPRPIDVGRFRPAPAEVRPGTIGFAGRLSDPRKNVARFVEVLGRCVAAGIDARGVLVGGSPAAAVLESASRVGLADRLRLVPAVPPDRLAAILRTIDVFLIPSNQEGLCLAALEAMACGCPVVSTSCGGPEEFVRDGETGFVAGFSGERLAAAVARIVTDRELRARLSNGARREVERRYSIDRACAIFDSAFDRTFERRDSA